MSALIIPNIFLQTARLIAFLRGYGEIKMINVQNKLHTISDLEQIHSCWFCSANVARKKCHTPIIKRLT